MTTQFTAMLLACCASLSLLAGCNDESANAQTPSSGEATTVSPQTESAPDTPHAYEQTPEGQQTEPRSMAAGERQALAVANGPGRLFVDLLDDDEHVSSVQVCASNMLNSVALTTNKRTLPKHGSEGGACQSFALDAGEHIMRISGAAGATIETIAFTTTRGRSFGPFGGSGSGQAFSMTVQGGPQGRLRGLKGLTTADRAPGGGLAQIALIDPASGGAGGTPFIDRLAQDEVVTAVTTCWRNDGFVQSVQLRTDKGLRARRGSVWPGQQCDTSALSAGEFITAVFGRAGLYLDAVGFETSTGRRIGPFGSAGGEGFRHSLPRPSRFVGLYGASGVWMDRIGLLSPMAGGTSASEFRDTLPAGASIRSVEVCISADADVPGATRVRSVRAVMQNGVSLPRHGAAAGAALSCQSLTLDFGEQVTEMSGEATDAIDTLRLRTSAGRTYGPFGTPSSAGQPFMLRNPHPVFLGFAGRASQPGNVDAGRVVALDFASPDLHAPVEPPSADAGQSGWWGDVAAWPLMGIHMALLPDGRVMSYGTDSSGSQGAQFLYDVWNPAQGLDEASHLTLPNTLATDLFCSSQSLLVDGSLLLAGGDGRDKGYNRGIHAVTRFTPANNSLSAAAPLRYARWYASQTVLANGDVLVLGGTDQNGALVNQPEVFDRAANAWRPRAAGGAGAPRGEFYPRAFTTRSTQAGGRAVWVISTSDGRIRRFEVDADGGKGRWTDSGISVGAYNWELPIVLIAPDQVLVQLKDGRTRLVSLPATGVASDKPVVVEAGAMSQPRAWSEMVLLPTGDVLALNGSATANTYDRVAYHAELWNRQTRAWQRLSSQMRPRLYHSAALLLSDGSVLSTGGGAPGPQNELNAQVYRPPYLFNGATASKRPSFSVSGGLTGLAHGQTLKLSSSNAADIARVTLIKLGSPTHSQNTEQRFIELAVSRDSQKDGLKVTLPAAPDIAPGGFYLLTVIDRRGVPSVSQIVGLNG